jgi:hypothetical protein
MNVQKKKKKKCGRSKVPHKEEHPIEGKQDSESLNNSQPLRLAIL